MDYINENNDLRLDLTSIINFLFRDNDLMIHNTLIKIDLD